MENRAACGGVIERGKGLHGAVAFFLRPDANGFVDGQNEDFAIADFARLGRLDDGGGGGGDGGVRHDDLNLDLR